MIKKESDSVLVSVCIPTHNRAAMLRACLASVLDQTFGDFELLVVDNASEDDTEAVAASFPDPRIRYHRNSSNIGLRNNWERCLELARGEFITIIPDDDMMLPRNLERKSRFLRDNPAVGLVHSKYHVVDADGNVVRYDTNWKHSADRMKDEMESRERMITHDGNFINAPTVMFRRDCYRRLGGFSEQLSYALDWEYWMRISVYYDIAFLAEPLVKWRCHAGSLTSNDLDNDGVKKLWEDLLAKKLIARNHLPKLEEGTQLERVMWQQMAARVSRLMAKMNCTENAALGFELCFRYPELLCCGEIPKSLVKSALGTRLVELVRRTTCKHRGEG